MRWLKALHIIFMVAWFSGLFYLPRLFVYHADSQDTISLKRFIIMERRLYYIITMPAGILTTFFGVWLLTYGPNYYLKTPWMYLKLFLVALLWIFHLYCGHLMKGFSKGLNKHSAKFYRFLNEFPTLILITVVILAVVRPHI